MLGNQARILVVEDDVVDRRLIRRYLSNCESHKLDIKEASDATQALLTIPHWLPDCIILDYNLPGLNGVELLEVLREHLDVSGVSFIMLTGQGNERVAADAFKCGTHEYLIKSQLSENNFIQVVLGSIERAQLQQALKTRSHEMQQVGYVIEQGISHSLSGLQQILKQMPMHSGESEISASINSKIALIDSHLNYLTQYTQDLAFYLQLNVNLHDMQLINLQSMLEVVMSKTIQLNQAGELVEKNSTSNVMGDILLIEKTFEFLLDVIKYSAGDQVQTLPLELELTEQDGYYNVYLTWIGVDIGSQLKEFLFQSFAPQLSESQEDNTLNSILRLRYTICRKIIAAHNGKLMYKKDHSSTRVGFIVSFPIIN